MNQLKNTSSNNSEKTNHLIHETSPYLQQHAHNPVNWYPWTEEALTRAKNENKPILLSIGYAACHWCHVMAHESFEDSLTAHLMNQLFINIKVDREERPDLDKVYQTAHYLLTERSGGWPLTVFLTPDDLTPFFSGTYFPKEAHYQLPAFKTVLQQIADIFQNHREEIKSQNKKLITILQREPPNITETVLTKKPLTLAIDILQKKFDSQHGGFGSAPKFPQPSKLEFLLSENSSMARITLQKMAEGGIYDQLEGGFFRYSVDEKWQIPHFEKMLYDNAQLLSLYVLAYQQFSETDLRQIAQETANWVIQKMQSDEGGYYSSLDADSEGQEGKFYLWDKKEIQSILTAKEFQLAEKYFGLDKKPNFENQWHFHQAHSIPYSEIYPIKQKLLAAKDKRIPPACDDKILTAWNALMIKAMVIAGSILQENRYIQSAERALHLIKDKLWQNNTLLVTYKNNKAHLPGYLDDYAFLLDALIVFFKWTQEEQYLTFAKQLADSLLNHFYDKERGGFFFTSDVHEKILYRSKTFMDEAIPNSNAVTINGLLFLGQELNESHYIEAAEKTLKNAYPALLHYPDEHCGLLIALKNYLSPFCTNTVCF